MSCRESCLLRLKYVSRFPVTDSVFMKICALNGLPNNEFAKLGCLHCYKNLTILFNLQSGFPNELLMNMCKITGKTLWSSVFLMMAI